ncbi:MAG: DUF4340 domain-containing protein [Proteobacteria bacterium]|nr:MAG: DUF4340 domain-containing protein [Pseudomonadota bacterium]
MKRKIWPSLLFALVGGALALYVALAGTTERESGQAWETFKFEDIQSVTYEKPGLKVSFVPLNINYGWIEYTEAGKAVQQFLAGPKGKNLWFNLSPFWASKVLGEASGLKLPSFGLDREDKRFTVVLRDESVLPFTIGERGFQSTDYFVLDPRKAKVFLWDRHTIDLLEDAPTRLALDTLGFLDPEGLDKLVLSAGGKERALVKESKVWKEGKAPLNRDDPLLTWLDGLSKIKAGGYVAQENLGASSEVLFRLGLESGKVWSLTVSKDSKTQAILLGLGEEKPSMVIDSKSFAPFYEELRLGKLGFKN